MFEKLTAYLKEARERGEFIGDDTELAANMFGGMIIGKFTPVRFFILHRDTSSHMQKQAHVSGITGRRVRAPAQSMPIEVR